MARAFSSSSFAIWAPFAFAPLTIYGLTSSSASFFELSVICLVCLISCSRMAALCTLPYIIYGPTAAMAGLPLFAIVTAALSIHALAALNASLPRTPSDRGFKYWFPILAVLLMSVAVSSLFATDTSYDAIVPYFQGVVVLLTLWILIREKLHIWCLAVSVCLASASAFVYKFIYFTSDTVPPLLARISLADTDWQTRVIYYLDDEFVKRFLWLGQEPNYTAALHFVPVGIALALFSSATKWRWLYLLSAALNILQIFGTLSRAGTLLALAMITVIFFQRNVSIHHRLAIGLALAGVTVAMFDEMGYIFSRLETVQSSLSGDGAGGRFAIWEHAGALVNQAPFFGIGPGGFRAAVGNAAHNTFLEAVVELGLVGGAVFALFLIFPALHAYRRGWAERGNFAVTSYVFYLMMGFTISFYQFYIVSFMAILCLVSPSLVDRNTPRHSTH